jgi:transcriptional regulator with XRE-family HTH domain
MLKIVWRGDELARLRRDRGLTQAELARKIGCDPSEVARWETRSDIWPRAARLVQIAIALGVTVEQLATERAA